MKSINVNVINEMDLKGDEIWDLLDSLESNEDISSKILPEISLENKCIGCNSINLEFDNSKGIVVCLDCSLINRELLDRNPDWNNFKDGKNTESRCGCPTNYFLPKSSLGTKVTNGRFSRISMLEKWGQMPYKERSLLNVLQDIEIKCKAKNVSKSIIENAKILFKHINDSKHLEGLNEGKNIIIRGLNRICLIAACVFNGATLQNIPLSPKEIGDIFTISEKQVTRGCRKFRDILKTHDVLQYIKSSQSHDFIARKAYVNKLNLESSHIDVSKKIARNVKRLDIAPDHQPRSIAAGSVMLMSHILDLNISKKNISETFRISQVTIMKTYRKIFSYRKVLIDDYACQKIINLMKIKEGTMKTVKEEELKKQIILDKNEEELKKQLILDKKEDLIDTDTDSDNINNLNIKIEDYLNIKIEDYLNISESPKKEKKEKKHGSSVRNDKKTSLISRYI